MAMAASSVCVVASASSKNYIALDARPLLRSNGALKRVFTPAAVPLVRSQLPGPASSGIASKRLGFSCIESSDSLGVIPISHSHLFKDGSNAKKESVFTCHVAESDAIEPPQPQSFLQKYPALVTGFFFFMWYLLNVIFNIMNKKIYNYFPYPYFVSTVHLVVGVAYCLIAWALGLPKRAPIDKALWLALTPVAFCHALGHVMTNVSFAAVAVSFTHTIKALEPFFNAAASQFILGQTVPLSLWLSLTPVVIGVSMASMTELSFNWTGFLTAMSSNISFTYRNIFSKKAMVGMDSTNLYAYISILSLAFCIPPFVIMEGPALLKHGFTDVVHKVGLTKFLSDLFFVGLFYHLYNQLAINTLERVAPLTHAVGNVLKRVFVIGFSIVVFGNKISTQTAIGTIIAIIGVAIYSLLKANIEEKKKAAAKLA